MHLRCLHHNLHQFLQLLLVSPPLFLHVPQISPQIVQVLSHQINLHQTLRPQLLNQVDSLHVNQLRNPVVNLHLNHLHSLHEVLQINQLIYLQPNPLLNLRDSRVNNLQLNRVDTPLNNLRLNPRVSRPFKRPRIQLSRQVIHHVSRLGNRHHSLVGFPLCSRFYRLRVNQVVSRLELRLRNRVPNLVDFQRCSLQTSRRHNQLAILLDDLRVNHLAPLLANQQFNPQVIPQVPLLNLPVNLRDSRLANQVENPVGSQLHNHRCNQRVNHLVNHRGTL